VTDSGVGGDVAVSAPHFRMLHCGIRMTFGAGKHAPKGNVPSPDSRLMPLPLLALAFAAFGIGTTEGQAAGHGGLGSGPGRARRTLARRRHGRAFGRSVNFFTNSQNPHCRAGRSRD